MKIISKNTSKNENMIFCVFCGEMIEVETKYYYIKYKDMGMAKSANCHCQCYNLADKLGLLERNAINQYSFKKRTVDFIVDLHKKGNCKIKKKTVHRQSLAHLIIIANNYFLHTESAEDKLISKETLKEVVSLYIVLFMMPRVVDDMVYDLERENKYRHKTKQVMKLILKDFENMSAALAEIYENETDLDNLIDNAMETYEGIQSCLAIEGLDRSANVLVHLVEVIGKKYDKISKEANVIDQIKQVGDIKKMLKNTFSFNKHKFVSFLIEDKCSSKDIFFVDK